MPTHRIATRTLLAAALALSMAACSYKEPTLQETRELTLTVNPGSQLVIEAGAGPMVLEGDDGDSIRVEAGIYQHAPNADYRLTLEADGDDGARLVAETTSGTFDSSDYIDLAIRVPRSIQLRIDDSSGSLRISTLDGDVDIEDESGSITISAIGGNVTIEDGSGSVTVEDVGGDVRIDDGSGSIQVTDVGGTVSIDDGSGSITVRDAGDFELRGDGSGSVNLSGIRSRDGSDG